MKHLKTYEQNSSHREIDLQLLWDDITNNYYKDLFDKPINTNKYFLSVLKDLLLNKEIEFKRVVNQFDGEVKYAFWGLVKDVYFEDDSTNYLIRHIRVLSNNGKTELKYNLGIISNNYNFDRKPLIIKIYNSEPLEIEERIDIIKNQHKYNL